METRETGTRIHNEDNRSLLLNFMNLQLIAMVDEALSTVGEYGEVRLIVEKGRLRFLVTQQSHDALKWQPGSIK